MKKINKLLYVEWYDAVGSENGWIDTSDAKKSKPVLIKSCGILLKEKKDYVTLVLSIDKINDNISGFITIPKKWIKKRKILK